jgi:hypothetical protein
MQVVDTKYRRTFEANHDVAFRQATAFCRAIRFKSCHQYSLIFQPFVIERQKISPFRYLFEHPPETEKERIN